MGNRVMDNSHQLVKVAFRRVRGRLSPEVFENMTLDEVIAEMQEELERLQKEPDLSAPRPRQEPLGGGDASKAAD
jgi:hypothetical protein